MHPRLLTSLILFEPFVHQGRSQKENWWIFLRAKQKDVWASRAQATTKTAKALAAWDPRVRERFAQYAFRELPTGLYPTAKPSTGSDKPVALTTPIAQEVATYLRPNLNYHREQGPYDKSNSAIPRHDSLFVPDVVGPREHEKGYYRPEGIIVWNLLPHLRPGTLVLSGAKSVLSTSGDQERAVARIGIGAGGSGGVADGRVRHVTLQSGHMVPFEKVNEAAGEMVGWIARERQRWEENERRIEEGWRGLAVNERIGLSREWKRLAEINEQMFGKAKL